MRTSESARGRSTLLVSLLAVLAAALALDRRAAHAQEVVLKSPDHSVEVRLVPIAGGTPTYPDFLVSWTHLPTTPSSGTLVFYREGANERSYISVGKAGPFVLVDNKEQTLVGGTVVPVYRLVLSTVPEPIELRVELGQHPKTDEIQRAYEDSQGLSHAGATKADVQSALDDAAKAFAQACGTKPKLDVKWADFAGERTRLASALGAVVRGVADQCAVQKYKAPIANLTTFRAQFDATLAADKLELQRAGKTVELKIGADVLNPRTRATAWIKGDL